MQKPDFLLCHISIIFFFPGYASDPECERGKMLMEERRRRRRRRRGEGRRVGRIENWQPVEEQNKKRERKKKEVGEVKRSRKYVHEILSGKSDELRSVRVRREFSDEEEDEEDLRDLYKTVQGFSFWQLTNIEGDR